METDEPTGRHLAFLIQLGLADPKPVRCSVVPGAMYDRRLLRPGLIRKYDTKVVPIGQENVCSELMDRAIVYAYHLDRLGIERVFNQDIGTYHNGETWTISLEAMRITLQVYMNKDLDLVINPVDWLI